MEPTSEKPPLFVRKRSPRRLRHEAQAKVFEKQSGSLEAIRQRLGLRPSQICEILKVHPSAWTRWTKTGKAPPHVFQMLEWYVELLQWRGQYREPKEASVLRALNQEDPSVYVPSEPADSVPLPSPEEGDKGPPQVSRRLFRVLVITLVVQALLWLGTFWVIYKRL